ncbi:MAG: diaminopimelate decarboxylase [Anaerotignum sp.]|nr:diaminopimelate decarboxylase [Anaerotignum sp.]
MKHIRKIREEYATPFYLYEGKIISEQASILKETFPDFDLLFSVKANPFPPVLRKIASLGIGADAASAKEVELALEAGMAPENIFYSCPAPTKEDIARIFGKCQFIADSFHALSLFEAEAAKRGCIAKAGLRLHPNFTMDGKPQGPSKFGIDEALVLDNPACLQEYPHLSVNGLHIHIRSQVLNTAQLGQYYKNVLELALRMQHILGVPLEYINFGGGVGYAYDKTKQSPLDMKILHDTVTSAAKAYASQLSARLLLESGRFLTCRCGTYVTEIVDIKRSHGKTYYVVKNGSNGFFKPVLQQLFLSHLPENIGITYEPFLTEHDDYNITVLSESKETETVDIAGHLCTGADVLAKDITLPKASIGDLVTFCNAGSYAYSLAPILFASQPAPQQIFLDEE